MWCIYPNYFYSTGTTTIIWLSQLSINTLRWRQNCRHFTNDIFKCICLKENVLISLKFVSNNMPALVQMMTWGQPGDKPLSEPMLVRLLMHICVTQPQWFNTLHWDVMVAIFQTALSNAFTWQKIFEFWTGDKPLPQPIIIQFNGIKMCHPTSMGYITLKGKGKIY